MSRSRVRSGRRWRVGPDEDALNVPGVTLLDDLKVTRL